MRVWTSCSAFDDIFHHFIDKFNAVCYQHVFCSLDFLPLTHSLYLALSLLRYKTSRSGRSTYSTSASSSSVPSVVVADALPSLARGTRICALQYLKMVENIYVYF